MISVERMTRPLAGFVVVMALILFTIDSTLAWIVKLLTGRSEG